MAIKRLHKVTRAYERGEKVGQKSPAKSYGNCKAAKREVKRNASRKAGVICLFRDLCGSWSKGQYFYHPVNRLEERRYDPVNEYRPSNDRASIAKQLNEK